MIDTSLRHDTHHAYGVLWTALSALTLSGLVPVLLVSTTRDSGRSSAWLGTLLLLVWAGIQLSRLIGRGEPRLFAFFWWVFVYVFLGLAPTVQLRENAMPSTTPGLSPSDDLAALGVFVIGVAAWEVGSLVGRRSHARVEQPRGLSRPRVTLLACLGVGFSLFFLWRVGIGAIGLNRAEFGAVRAREWPDLATSSIVFAVAVYVTLLAAHARSALGKKDGSASLLRPSVLLLAILPVMIANPIGNARYVSGTVIFGVLILLGVVSNVSRTRLTLAAILAGFLFLFPIADLFRREGFRAERSGFFSEYAGAGDYDVYGQMINAVSFVGQNGITWGYQLLGSLFFWVPRGVWPSKPVDTGVLLANFRGYDFTNLSAPLWAEFLVNFGITGVVLGMFVVGLLVARFDNNVAHSFLSGAIDPFWRVFGAVLPVYFVILLRGSLLQATGGLAVILAALWFMRGARVRPAPMPT